MKHSEKERRGQIIKVKVYSVILKTVGKFQKDFKQGISMVHFSKISPATDWCVDGRT